MEESQETSQLNIMYPGLNHETEKEYTEGKIVSHLVNSIVAMLVSSLINELWPYKMLALGEAV